MRLTKILIGLALVIDGASFYLIERICLLVLLWVVAVIDWKECRIPNWSIIIGILSKAFIVFLEIISNKFVVEELLLEFIAAAFLFAISLVCRNIMKNAIGAGDIKLLVIMAFYLGWHEIWNAVFFSLVIFVVVAICLLISKKKTKGDSVPFAPAFAVGTSLACLF